MDAVEGESYMPSLCTVISPCASIVVGDDYQ